MIEINNTDAQMLIRALVCLHGEGGVNDSEVPALKLLVKKIDTDQQGSLKELYGNFYYPFILEEFKEYKHRCEVCDCITDQYSASPFLPYTGYKCQECFNEYRIPYQELMCVLCSKSNNYKERLEEFRIWWLGSKKDGTDNGVEYAEKYWLPTMKFFNKTPEEAWREANNT